MPNDTISRLYADDLNECQNLSDLQRVVNEWIELAPETWNVVKYLGDGDFRRLRKFMNILIQGMKVDETIPDNLREILWPSVINLTKYMALQMKDSREGYALYRMEISGLVKNIGNRSAPRLYVTKLGHDFALKSFGIMTVFTH